MSSENTLTGRNGDFRVGGTEVARCTGWDLTRGQAGGSEWGDSDSAGFTNRSPGRKDATWNSGGKYDTTDEVWDLFEPEDIAECHLYLEGDLYYWHFPRALCTNFAMSVNIDTEEVIGWTSSWGSDGAFTYPGQA